MRLVGRSPTKRRKVIYWYFAEFTKNVETIAGFQSQDDLAKLDGSRHPGRPAQLVHYLGPGGFPSGHTIAAFSIATVFAERYHRHRWVPWTAYGLAGLIGFSRVTLQAHFPSDVFAERYSDTR